MKTWFITGASRGFGRIWAEAALRRGDRVAVTARNAADVTDLAKEFGEEAALPLALDVTDASSVKAAVQQAHQRFKHLDIVLNNAGFPLAGALEEVTEDQVRTQFDTNYLGTLRVIQAALPILREQGAGHIIGTSSTIGLIALPLLGQYCASKWAFEAMHESLSAEVKPFGIRVSLIEPGAYATEFGRPDKAVMANPMESYAELRSQFFGQMSSMQRGDPKATANAVLQLVDADDPPLRLILGNEGIPTIRATYADRLKTWEAWQAVSDAAQGEAKAAAGQHH